MILFLETSQNREYDENRGSELSPAPNMTEHPVPTFFDDREAGSNADEKTNTNVHETETVGVCFCETFGEDGEIHCEDAV